MNSVLRYCILVNSYSENSPIDSVGFFQWSKVFNGEILNSHEVIPNLKDDDFDLIHVRVSSANFNIIKQVREKIGKKSKTKIILSIDTPPEVFYDEFPNYDDINEELMAGFFFFTADLKFPHLEKKTHKKFVYKTPPPAD